jgi:hypothetical protein
MKTKTPKPPDMAKLDAFTLICDVIYRASQGWPVDSWKDDICPHTSEYARTAARRIWKALELNAPTGTCGAPEIADHPSIVPLPVPIEDISLIGLICRQCNFEGEPGSGYPH